MRLHALFHLRLQVLLHAHPKRCLRHEETAVSYTHLTLPTIYSV